MDGLSVRVFEKLCVKVDVGVIVIVDVIVVVLEWDAVAE